MNVINLDALDPVYIVLSPTRLLVFGPTKRPFSIAELAQDDAFARNVRDGVSAN